MKTQQIISFFACLSLLLGGCQSTSPVTATATSVPTPTTVPTVAPPTPMPSVAYVGGFVPCFAGPNVDQNVVSSVEIGEGPEILGKDSSGDYWIINRKDGQGYCWIEAHYVTVSEDPGSIRYIIMPTRTAIPPVPNAPIDITSEVECQISKWPFSANIRLSWKDVEGEKGYRIYRDGNLLAELAANEINYVDAYTENRALRRNKSMLLHYSLEAFNDTGSSVPAELPVAFLCRL